MKTSHYADGFAEAIVNAYVNGKKSVVFDHTRYAVSTYIDNVLEDIRNGSCEIKVKDCKVIVKEMHK